MRNILTVLFIIVFGAVIGQNRVLKTVAPSWVNEVEFTDKKELNGSSGFQYLLIDSQEHYKEKQYYYHYAIKVLNAEGVQEFSDISVVFDPSYQQLFFHDVRIVRGDKVVEKLSNTLIQTLQRESSMERSLYDGSTTAVLNLSDVRVDDIIEYSYSIKGSNIINKGNFSGVFYQNFSSPVNRIYNRILSPRELHLKVFENAASPEVTENKGLVSYVWDLEAKDFIVYDNNIPSWYNPQARVSYTTFSSWKDVVDWATPIYKYSENDEAPIPTDLLENNNSLEDKIITLIRFVQDDIRYLGFESGISAYQPNKPKKVLRQRYGDCKDKSLLLVSFLRKIGVESYPVLVNTVLRGEVEHEFSSNTAFDHCIVNFKHKDKYYFVDPTISQQGGDLYAMSPPSYEKGLVIRDGETKLVDVGVQNSQVPQVIVNEIIDVKTIGGSALYTIESSYSGNKADYFRSYFSSNSKGKISKNYQNYYATLYPKIELKGEIEFEDDSRESDNIFVIKESYVIEDFWEKDESEDYLFFETYPMVLSSSLTDVGTASRTMPYDLGSPYSYLQLTKIRLPEKWNANKPLKTVSNNVFTYATSVMTEGSEVEISHQYELHKSSISPHELDVFFKDQEKVKSEFSYMLTYGSGIVEGETGWISYFLLFFGLLTAVIFFYKLYFVFDPKPLGDSNYNTIGGWLVLPVIGVVLSIFALPINFYNVGFLDENMWLGLDLLKVSSPMLLKIFVGIEIIYNCWFWVFTITLIFLFIKKRTSLPLLMSVFYIVNFLFLLLDNLVYEWANLGMEDSEGYKEIIKAGIGMLIWVPYFNVSERVKQTFCVRSKVSDKV